MAKEYTSEPRKLLTMIQEVHPLVQHKSAKGHLKRLENKLRFQIDDEDMYDILEDKNLTDEN